MVFALFKILPNFGLVRWEGAIEKVSRRLVERADWKSDMSGKNGGKRTNREWARLEERFADLPEARDAYEGFCPILPVRLTYTHDPVAMREATRKRAIKKGYDAAEMSVEELDALCQKDRDLFIRPNSDRYDGNVCALRRYFIREVGYVRPMTGKVRLDIEVIVPSDEDYEAKGTPERYRPKYDVDNCFKPIQDALNYRTKTADWQKVGILVDDIAIVEIRGTKHERKEGERCGFHWRIHRVGDGESTQANVNDRISAEHTTERQRRFAQANTAEHSDKWEDRLHEGLDATARVRLRLALLATDTTPLDPVIAMHYLALRPGFNRDVASKLALDEQSHVSFELALGRDAEEFLCEIEAEAKEMAEKEGVDLSVVKGAMSIRDLNRIAA